MSFTPDTIRERLTKVREPVSRGDVITGQRLLGTPGLEDFEDAGHGSVPSSGIPYGRGAGAPGVRIKRKPAAVLVPIIDRRDGHTVLFTLRPEDMNRHAGQVSFPGGRVDAGDVSPEAAALREAHEEVRIDPETVDILGRLDPYLTITGFEVVPIVGLVPPQNFEPEPGEVADIFEVPLGFLMDGANHRRVRRTVNGNERAYYAMPYEKHYIWGATAGMIMNLYEVLHG